MSLLVAKAPAGSHLSAAPAGVFAPSTPINIVQKINIEFYPAYEKREQTISLSIIIFLGQIW
ncbi:hypothetical protein B1NLA3E_14570 [Bacillus sp. 1NLA3E]|nr:hypothetical protein B1NLA3E_14570 [Bacillus sp. 1NLA3E]